MSEIIEDLKRSIECTKSYGLTSIKTQQEEKLINYVEDLQQRIDEATEYIENNATNVRYGNLNGDEWYKKELHLNREELKDLLEILEGKYDE